MTDDELRHPTEVLIRSSARLWRIIRARDTRAAQAQLMSLDRSRLIPQAIRSWLLILSELSAARLPGGALAEPGNAGGLIRMPVGDDERPWQLDMRDSLRYAADRDGERLYAAVDRALGRRDVLAYVTALAAGAQQASDALGLRAELVNATHLLGYYSGTAGHWSVAGYGLRQIMMTLTVMDTGQEMAEAILGPEIDSLAGLSSSGRGRLLGVLGASFGAIMGQATEHEPHPMSGTGGAESRVQRQAADLAMMIGGAYRDHVHGTDDLIRLASRLTHADVGLGLFGLGNMLAVRCRELWGNDQQRV